VDDDRVVDSRPADGGEAVRRRRGCEACGERFSTIERVVLTPLQVRKRFGDVHPFDRQKVHDGMDRAANGRVPAEAIDDAAAAVERGLRATGERVVTTEQVGLHVLAQLRDLDPVAYVRFASVYKNFEGPEDFHKELVGLSKEEPARD
jgi:transcriptional repressor NrdR